MTGRDYQLRYAAGCCWLITMYQNQEEEYRSPISLNEVGAGIWESLVRGESVSQIAGRMEEEYGISRQEALEDIQEFLAALRDKGIDTLFLNG